VHAGEVAEDGVHLFFGEDGGEAIDLGGMDFVVNRLFQQFVVGEEEGLEGLVLGGGGDVFVDGQVGEEGLDFGGAHILRWRLSW